jgi:hypothetical protein
VNGLSQTPCLDATRGINAAYEAARYFPCPDVMSGTAVFPGTRVPLQTLLDYLEGGESIDDFLAGFPAVRRE